MAKVTGVDEVFKNLDGFERRMKSAAKGGADLTAIQMASYAKKNRRWKDQTNVARAGLTGTSEQTGSTVKVAIAHTPFYGVFLELANGGRFSILEDTIREHRQKFLENVKSLVRL